MRQESTSQERSEEYNTQGRSSSADEQERAEYEMTEIRFRTRAKEERGALSQDDRGGETSPHLDLMFMGDEEGGKTLAFLVARERERPCSARWSQEVHGRLDLLEVDGVASRNRIGVRRHHCEVGQRTCADESHRLMERIEGHEQWIEDDHREQVSGQFGVQHDHRESNPIRARIIRTVRIETEEMSCLFVCHSHLTSITVLTAVWAQACGLKAKTPLS